MKSKKKSKTAKEECEGCLDVEGCLQTVDAKKPFGKLYLPEYGDMYFCSPKCANDAFVELLWQYLRKGLDESLYPLIDKVMNNVCLLLKYSDNDERRGQIREIQELLLG